MVEKPTKIFTYPGGERMCQDGLVRAAYTGLRILKCELTLEDIKIMAHKGEKALENNASTNKRNLIYLMVYRHGRYGDLENYVTIKGDFLLNYGNISNVYSERHRVALNILLNTGILQD